MDTFECSVLDALERMASIASHSLDCVVATPVIGEAAGENVIAGIRRVWTALDRILRPTGTALLVFDDRQAPGILEAELAWRVALALKTGHWILRNALIGPVANGRSSQGIGFLFVTRSSYHFDVDAVRAKYDSNPGDVVLGSDTIVDRFAAATRRGSGPVTELFVGGARREVAA